MKGINTISHQHQFKTLKNEYMFAEILGWIATLFRGAGMLAKKANMVKYLVSIGNLFWMLNGIFTSNVPLIVSNGFCLLVMGYEILKPKKGGK